MKSNGAFACVLVFVLLVAPFLVFAPSHIAKAYRTSGAPVYFEIDPVAVPPLTDINPQNTGLEVPGAPSAIGDYFNVSIYLKNATLTNVPLGVVSVGIIFDFTNILHDAALSGAIVKPVSFVDCLGMGAGCALTGPQSSLFYGGQRAQLSATNYEVAAVSYRPWNGTSGLVAVIQFQIIAQPSVLLGQPNFGPNTLDLSYGDIVDPTIALIPFDVVQGSLTIDTAPPPAPKLFITPITFAGPAALGATFNYTVMITADASWDVVGFDIVVTWNNTLINLVAYSEGSFLHQGNASTSGNFITTNVSDLYSLRAVFNKTTDPVPSALTDSLLQLEFNVTFISDSYPDPTCPIAFGPTDLVSWPHPERLDEPWHGSITEVDLAPFPGWSTTNASYIAPLSAHAHVGTGIYINSDGTITPPTAPISSSDNVTYVLTSNVTSTGAGVVVERDNIVIDGAGYTIQEGPQGGNQNGIYLLRRSNVTIINTNIKDFECDICLDSCSNNIISGNNLTQVYGVCLDARASFGNTITGNNIDTDGDGVCLTSSNNNNITGNNIQNAWHGIWLEDSNYNSIIGNSIYDWDWIGIYFFASSGNDITRNDLSSKNQYVEGVYLSDLSSENRLSENRIDCDYYALDVEGSSYNNVTGNDLTSSLCGIGLYYPNAAIRTSYNIVTGNNVSAQYAVSFDSSASDNVFCHNNFFAAQVDVETQSVANVWDDGYPSGGNYWSDYTGVDVCHGPSQNIAGSDGIGDTPYTIDANNLDNYPLMNPWSPPDIAVTNLTCAKTVIVQDDLCNLNVAVANLGSYYETFNVTAYANMTAIGVQTVTVFADNSTVILFKWNTTGFALGNYTVKAVADTVPGETNTANNILTYYRIAVTIPGDLNGDFRVNLADLSILVLAYGSRPRDPNWNSNADLALRGIIDLTDLVTLASHYGQHYP